MPLPCFGGAKLGPAIGRSQRGPGHCSTTRTRTAFGLHKCTEPDVNIKYACIRVAVVYWQQIKPGQTFLHRQINSKLQPSSKQRFGRQLSSHRLRARTGIIIRSCMYWTASMRVITIDARNAASDADTHQNIQVSRHRCKVDCSVDLFCFLELFAVLITVRTCCVPFESTPLDRLCVSVVV